MVEKLTSEMPIEFRIVAGKTMKLLVKYAKCKSFATEWRTSKNIIETTDWSHGGDVKNALGGSLDCRKNWKELMTLSEQSERI